MIKPSAVRELEALPSEVCRRVVAKIGALSADPRPPGCEKLSGRSAYRVRKGSYRVLYTVDDGELLVRVIKVGHRRDVYR